MKHLKYLLCISLALAMNALVSCNKDDVADLPFALSQNELTVEANGEVCTLQVQASGAWYASSPEPWVSVSPATGVGCQECVVTIDSTLINGVRRAQVQFSCEGQPTQLLSVVQTGYGYVVAADSAAYTVKATGRSNSARTLKMTVTTNVAFDVKVVYPEGTTKQWLRAQDVEVNLDRGARPRTTTLRFNWDSNTLPEARTAEVHFLPKDPAVQLTTPSIITITQQAAQFIEDSPAGDSLALLAIANALGMYTDWASGENMRNWEDVTLWERTDKDLPCPEATGRVRAVRFALFETDETLPAEVRYLKYAEHVSFFSNVNSFLKDIDLGPEVCELQHLKTLEVYAYGIKSLPDELVKLGPTLETLTLTANNFNEIPAILTKENFPHLKSLDFIANRRWTCSDLRQKNEARFDGGIGLHFHTASDDALKRLFLWDTLEELRLSYNYMEGSLPDFQVGVDGVEAWTQADIDAFGGDTIQWLLGKPKILPRMKRLSTNLNFLTGTVPDWLLYHPHLLDWDPDILIFNQQEDGRDSEGRIVRFDNTPHNYEYYFQAFPKFRAKYEMQEE